MKNLIEKTKTDIAEIDDSMRNFIEKTALIETNNLIKELEPIKKRLNLLTILLEGQEFNNGSFPARIPEELINSIDRNLNNLLADCRTKIKKL